MAEHKPTGPNRKQGQRLTGVKTGIAAVAIGFTVGAWGILANGAPQTSQAANTTAATPVAVVVQTSPTPTSTVALPTATATAAPPTPTTQAAATAAPPTTAPTTAPTATAQPAPTATAQPAPAASSTSKTTAAPQPVTRTRSSK